MMTSENLYLPFPPEIVGLIVTQIIHPWTIDIQHPLNEDATTLASFTYSPTRLRLVSRTFDDIVKRQLRRRFDGRMCLTTENSRLLCLLPSWLDDVVREIRVDTDPRNSYFLFVESGYLLRFTRLESVCLVGMIDDWRTFSNYSVLDGRSDEKIIKDVEELDFVSFREGAGYANLMAGCRGNDAHGGRNVRVLLSGIFNYDGDEEIDIDIGLRFKHIEDKSPEIVRRWFRPQWFRPQWCSRDLQRSHIGSQVILPLVEYVPELHAHISR